jgi:conjugative transfer pilus assembly protein TraH
MNHYDHPHLRRSAATFWLLLAIPSFQLQAGDLNSEVNNMFNNLGAIGNYTPPVPSAARPSIPTPAAT